LVLLSSPTFSYPSSALRLVLDDFDLRRENERLHCVFSFFYFRNDIFNQSMKRVFSELVAELASVLTFLSSLFPSEVRGWRRRRDWEAGEGRERRFHTKTWVRAVETRGQEGLSCSSLASSSRPPGGEKYHETSFPSLIASLHPFF
jgi:hypothetical protein